MGSLVIHAWSAFAIMWLSMLQEPEEATEVEEVEGPEEGEEAEPEEAPWEHDAVSTIEAAQFYSYFTRIGFSYGPTFHVVNRVSTEADTAAQIKCVLHPAACAWLG